MAHSTPTPILQSHTVAPLLRVRDLRVHFPLHRGMVFQRQMAWIKAVDGLSFDIDPGKTLSLVGESGCGKSTAGLAILRMLRPTSGNVYLGKTNLTQLDEEALWVMRQQMQMVFQDASLSINPHRTIGDILGEPLDIFGVPGNQTRLERIVQLLEMVGLQPELIYRYPYEFSKEHRLRIGIARALALDPAFLVCDEPMATLDTSVQAPIIYLLQTLQQQLGLTYLFISHDLSVVGPVSDRIAVMYRGKIVELGDRLTLYSNPLHPYTQALLSVAPIPKTILKASQRVILQGNLASLVNPPPGCRFHPRCPIAQTVCCQDPEPPLHAVEPGHYVACHLAHLPFKT